jgi:DNA-binding beta-propeller fold protein YncE
MNRVFFTGFFQTLYMVDPQQPAGQVTVVSTSLGQGPKGIAFDGQRIWTANNSGFGTGSISIINPSNTLPWPVINITQGFNAPHDILFDGSNMWVTDDTSLGSQGAVKKLDSTGAIIQTISIEGDPGHMAFDGTNIWVPSSDGDTVTVIRAATGTVIATLSGNGLFGPFVAAFDGERVLITNPIANRVSLWRASDLTPLGSFDTGSGSEPTGVCSDGINFWITLRGAGKVARF